MQTILLVEDDAALAMGLKFTFEDDYKVLHAPDAKTAEQLIDAGGFDLVVMDVMLPDGNGYDLCARLRKKSQAPVIFLSALDDEVNAVMGLDTGGDDYVTKPFRLKELMSRVKAQLRRSAGEPGGVLSIGDVSINTARHTAQGNGHDLMLTLTEFKLLCALVRHQGQVLSRGQLLDMLWDNRGEFVDDNTLSVHVRHLREKLEAAQSRVEIITVRGMGYGIGGAE